MAEKSKRVFMMRHGEAEKSDDPTSWQGSAPLSLEGRKTIRKIFERNLEQIVFQLYGSSPFLRAIQTAEIVANGNHVIKFNNLKPVSEEAWNIWSQRDPKATEGSVAEMFVDPAGGPLLMVEGDNLFHFIKSMADRLQNGQNAFLVSHQPLIECAVAYATGVWPPVVELKKGEIVVFFFNESSQFHRYEIIHLP